MRLKRRRDVGTGRGRDETDERAGARNLLRNTSSGVASFRIIVSEVRQSKTKNSKKESVIGHG
jgi:hypothetical protein